MSKNIKQLAVIYTAAVISGVTAFGYINSTINALLVMPASPQNTSTLQVQPESKSARLYTSVSLQGGKITTSGALNGQPNLSVVQRTNEPQPAQGGSGQEYELQPAMGYGALGWTMQ